MHTHTWDAARTRPSHPRPAHPSTRVRARFGAGGIAVALGVLAAALFGPASPAQAHDQLLDTVFDTTETGEAKALRLSFSDDVLTSGIELYVTDAADQNVGTGAPVPTGRDVVQALDAPLSDGSYRAVWRVVSSDGHPIEGGFTFDIAGGQASNIAAIDLTKLNDTSGQSSASGQSGASGQTDTAKQQDTSDGDSDGFPVGAIVAISAGAIGGALGVMFLLNRKRRPLGEADKE